jgi:hypothetical protein
MATDLLGINPTSLAKGRPYDVADLLIWLLVNRPDALADAAKATGDWPGDTAPEVAANLLRWKKGEGL